MHSQALLLNMSAVDVGGGGVAVYIQRPPPVFLNCILPLFFSTVFSTILLNSISEQYFAEVTVDIRGAPDVCREFAGILSLVQQLH